MFVVQCVLAVPRVIISLSGEKTFSHVDSVLYNKLNSKACMELYSVTKVVPRWLALHNSV